MVVAVVVADRTPAGGLRHVLVVREAAVLVRAQVARVIAGAVRVAVAAAVALVVSFGALGRTPVVLVGVAAEPVARAVRVLVAAPGAGVVPGGAALEVVGFDEATKECVRGKTAVPLIARPAAVAFVACLLYTSPSPRDRG